VPAHRAAVALARGVMALSPLIAQRVALPVVNTTTNLALFCVSATGEGMPGPLPKVTDQKKRKENGEQLPAAMWEASAELCRHLTFLDEMLSLDAHCIVLVGQGALFPAFTAMHCASEQVATLGLQVLTTAYRTLGRVGALLKAGMESLQVCMTNLKTLKP